MARRSFTKKDRAHIFNAHLGVCHICSGKIGVAEPWEVEHVIPYAMTQDDSDQNLRPAHVACHKVKTHQEDRPRINKAERMRLKHMGAYPKPVGNARIQGRGFSSTRRTVSEDSQP